MANPVSWLRDEIQLWIKDGTVDQTTADRILARYEDVVEKSWTSYLLTGIGSLVFGLGIILVFAYNWADMHKFLKLAVVFASIVGAHGVGIMLTRRNPTRRNLVEGFHLLGTMLFGAGIWLIAQIYHMDEHYPNAFLAWGAGALVLAWALPSVLQGILATVLLTAWGLAETTDFKDVHWVGPLTVAIAIIPLAWYLKSRFVLFLALASSVLLLMFNSILVLGDNYVVLLCYSLSLVLLAAALIVPWTNFPQAVGVLRFIGGSTYGFILVALSFFNGIRLLGLMLSEDGIHVLVWLFLIGAALFYTLAMLIRFGWLGRKAETAARFSVGGQSTDRLTAVQHVLVLAVTVLVMFWMTGLLSRATHLVLVLVANLALLTHAIVLMLQGIRYGRRRWIVIGFLVTAIVIYVRFLELFDSLLLRAVVFLLLGAVLFYLGHRFKGGVGVRAEAEDKPKGEAHA